MCAGNFIAASYSDLIFLHLKTQDSKRVSDKIFLLEML